MMNDILPQHAASNLRLASDEFLHPDHFPFKECIDDEIKLLKESHEYVEISQERIAQLRQESNNTLNYGDAIEKILKKELNSKSYPGMIEGHKVLEGFYTEDVESRSKTYDLEDEVEESNVKHKKIFTSLFDSTTKTTYYFLKA